MAAEYSREEVTTTVVRLRIKTPAHWNDVSQVWWHARHELNEFKGRPADTTPYDDEIWYEPGDEDIAVCFERTERVTDGKTRVAPPAPTKRNTQP